MIQQVVANRQVLSVDADWDDESGQVEVRIEAQVDCAGLGNVSSIRGFAFHVKLFLQRLPLLESKPAHVTKSGPPAKIGAALI